MKKATELKLLKEQLQQMTEKVNAFEKSLQPEDIWKLGHWFPRSGKAEHLYCAPPAYSTEQGFVFTTEANCQAWIDYQKACVVVRDACKPYLARTMDIAYIPAIAYNGTAIGDGASCQAPRWLWIEGKNTAKKIAEQCKAELLIIQNFKWEI